MLGMPMERTVGLSIALTAINCLRTEAVFVTIYTILTVSEPRLFQNRHISSLTFNIELQCSIFQLITQLLTELIIIISGCKK
jgi:hypothetical protein